MTSTEFLQKGGKESGESVGGNLTQDGAIRATQRSMHAFLQSKVQKKSGSTAFKAREEEEEEVG